MQSAGVDWFALGGVAVFYVIIFIVGIVAARLAGRRKEGEKEQEQSETVMVGKRNIGMFVGVCTMTATWVGGGYINGAAEKVFAHGLLACQAPIGYALSLVVGGAFFAGTMRRANYITMLDPFQNKYGQKMGGLLFIPALLGEVLWCAAILSALGSTIAVIINFGNTASVIVSTLIAVGYTLFGGLYSVAYTDVVQLFCVTAGLILCIPFAIQHEAVSPLSTDVSDWMGHVPTQELGQYFDKWLMLICGGLPWQAYFQRVLSSKSVRAAQVLSFAAGFGCIALAIPPIIVGAIAKSTNFTMTEFGREIGEEVYEQKLVLPLSLRYLCPPVITFFGLGAVSAAVMSSADSSILSASSMFSHNVYQLIFRPKASEREILWVIRVSICGVGALACIMGLTIHSIYGLFLLCSDLVYVVLFPQLVCVIYLSFSNTYGSITGYFVSLVLRLAGGEPIILLPALIHYPFYEETSDGLPHQLFPFKTFSMLCGLVTIIVVSKLADFLFTRQKIDRKYDFLNCFNIDDRKKAEVTMKESKKLLTEDE